MVLGGGSGGGSGGSDKTGGDCGGGGGVILFICFALTSDLMSTNFHLCPFVISGALGGCAILVGGTVASLGLVVVLPAVAG